LHKCTQIYIHTYMSHSHVTCVFYNIHIYIYIYIYIYKFMIHLYIHGCIHDAITVWQTSCLNVPQLMHLRTWLIHTRDMPYPMQIYIYVYIHIYPWYIYVYMDVRCYHSVTSLIYKCALTCIFTNMTHSHTWHALSIRCTYISMIYTYVFIHGCIHGAMEWLRLVGSLNT